MSPRAGRPGIDDEDIGIRALLTKRTKAVERSMDRLRRGLGEDWRVLEADEVERVEWMLGELWSYLPHAEWESLRVGEMGLAEVRMLLSYANELRGHGRPSTEILDDAQALVRRAGLE